MTDVLAPGLSQDTRALMMYEAAKKSVGVSYLLWFFLGGFGGHRFYNGRNGSAVAMLLLWIGGWLTIWIGIGFIALLAVGVWLIVDAFLIPGWVSEHNTRLLMQLDKAAVRQAAPVAPPIVSG